MQKEPECPALRTAIRCQCAPPLALEFRNPNRFRRDRADSELPNELRLMLGREPLEEQPASRSRGPRRPPDKIVEAAVSPGASEKVAVRGHRNFRKFSETQAVMQQIKPRR